jgi:hypothetical protein
VRPSRREGIIASTAERRPFPLGEKMANSHRESLCQPSHTVGLDTPQWGKDPVVTGVVSTQVGSNSVQRDITAALPVRRTVDLGQYRRVTRTPHG